MTRTIKSALLAAAALLPLAVRPAHAQLAVIDEQVAALEKTSWAMQANEMANHLTVLNQQLLQAQRMWQLLNNPVALLEAAPGLLTGEAQSPLGQDLAATGRLVSGFGQLQGTTSRLTQSIANGNTFYMPALNSSFVAQMLTARSNQTSAIQAQYQTLMNGMSDRMEGLQALQARINAGGDLNTMASLQARMQSEVAIAQQQGAQMQALAGTAALQAQIEQQQYQQKGARDSDDFLAAKMAGAGGLVSFNRQQQPVPTNWSAAAPLYGSVQ